MKSATFIAHTLKPNIFREERRREEKVKYFPFITMWTKERGGVVSILRIYGTAEGFASHQKEKKNFKKEKFFFKKYEKYPNDEIQHSLKISKNVIFNPFSPFFFFVLIFFPSSWVNNTGDKLAI